MNRRVSAPYLWAFAGSVLALGAALLFLLSLGIRDEAARAHYETLSSPVPPMLSSLSRKVVDDAHHERRGVRRDFLRQHNGERLKMRLQADRAELRFEPGSKSLQELLYSLDIWVQEKITRNPPDLSVNQSVEQSVRYFQAAQAVYSFHEDHLVSKDTVFSELKLPFENLPEDMDKFQPIYKFQAVQVEMPLRSREKEWSAVGVQGKVCPGVVPCSQK